MVDFIIERMLITSAKEIMWSPNLFSSHTVT